MPPKPAAKEKVVKGDEAEELVLQYLKSVNRPYASTDVSANLKNKVPKAAAQKVLMTLAEKGQLTMKTYGKQTIFVYNQASELLPALPQDELEELDQELKNVRSQVEEQKKELKALQTELSNIETMPRTGDLSKEIGRIKAENDVNLKALLAYKGDSDGGDSQVQPLTAEQIKRIDEEFTRWRKEWESRRRIYKSALGLLQDGGLVNNVAEFEEEQGIALDDEEALEIENGEFCKPVPKNGIKPKTTTTTKSTPTAMRSSSSKKAIAPSSGDSSVIVIKRTGSTAEEGGEGSGKKKKTRKA